MQKKSVKQVARPNQTTNNLIVPVKTMYTSSQSFVDMKGDVQTVSVLFEVDTQRKKFKIINDVNTKEWEFYGATMKDYSEVHIATLEAMINAIQFSLKLLKD